MKISHFRSLVLTVADNVETTYQFYHSALNLRSSALVKTEDTAIPFLENRKQKLMSTYINPAPKAFFTQQA